MTDLDTIRSYVYNVALDRGRPPLRKEIARALESSESSVGEALAELSARRVLVLQPDGEILMAPPFSAVPTPYVVTTDSLSGFVNCGWDALGAAVMLRRPTVISASCADCGQALRLESDGHSVQGDSLVLHFPIPARRWWESIVFT
jgi:Alkylmercury lyase